MPPSLEISNVVGWISYRQELDLAVLGDALTNREEVTSVIYEPAENHWLQTKFAPDDTYVAFYRSGSCSITGVDSVEHFEEVVERVNAVMRELLQLDFTPESKISNIVITTSLNMNVQLEAVALQLGFECTEYEPEQFPALIYRDSEYDATILLFSSGKLLCTGLDNLDDIESVIELFITELDCNSNTS